MTPERLALMMLLPGLLLSGGARAAEWDPRWFNPQPAEGDLILPLPCGGAMAFRPVDVPSGPGPLDDRADRGPGWHGAWL